MGVVYEARHVSTGGTYALKAIELSADAELLLRFEREGEAQARVGTHPNVVKVHASGRAEGCAYLVMDLAPGGDLRERLREGLLDPQAAAQLVRDLALGLAHVHSCGVLHRDLKPANVVFDEEGRPKLVDFGLAVLEGADSLTETGTVLGTPAYMAPEQAKAARDQIDERTDVYGLGAILYAALTGQPPFKGSSALVVLGQVCTDAPDPPSALAPVPPRLETICLRALSKEADRRQQSSADLARELDNFLAGTSSLRARSWSLGVLVLSVLATLGASLLSLLAPAPTTLLPPSVAKTPVQETPAAELERIKGLTGLAGLLACEAFSDQHKGSLPAAAAEVEALRERLIRKPLLRIPVADLREARFTPDQARLLVRSGRDWKRTHQGKKPSLGRLQVYSLSGTEGESMEFSLDFDLNDVTLDPSVDRLAVCGRSGWVEAYNLQGERLSSVRRTPKVSFGMIAISPCGEWLVAGGKGKLIVFSWPRLHARPPRPIADRVMIDRICFDAHGALYVVSANKQGVRKLEVFDTLDAAPRVLFSPAESAGALRVTSDGVIAIGYGSGNLTARRHGEPKTHQLSPPRREAVSHVLAHSGAVRDLAFGPRGSVLYSISNSPDARNDLFRWSLDDFAQPGVRAQFGRDRDQSFVSIDVSRDGRLVLLAHRSSSAGRVELWALERLWPDP